MDAIFEYASKLTPSEWGERLSLASAQQVAFPVPRFPDRRVQKVTNGRSGANSISAAMPCYIKSAAYLIDKYGDLSNKKLLDFGCGWGRFSRLFMQVVNPENIYGVDVDRALVQSCGELLSKERFSELGETGRISHDDGYFDLVFANSVFSHLSLDVHERSMAEIARVMKKGGAGIITIMGDRQIDKIFSGGNPHLKQMIGSYDSVKSRLDSGEVAYIPLDKAWPDYGLIFFPEGYLERLWDKHFRVNEISRDHGGSQDIYFVERK